MILNSPTISGSLTVTGNIIASGSITLSGSVASASFAASASNALAAQTASTTPNAVTTASISGPTISFSKGNASTFNLTVNNVTSASYSNASTNTTLLNNTASTVFATTGSNILTGTQYISNTNDAVGFSNTTSSIYTDGGFQVTKNAYFSSSMFIKGNLTVFGTQSVSFITSSQLNISTNLITVNTDTPSIRFGGLAVYDSGSTGLTGSILWDSQENHWIYTNPSGSSYSGGMLISGPRASSLGNEQGTTSNAIMKGMGGDHITSSAMFESASFVGIGTSAPGNLLHLSSSSTSATGIRFTLGSEARNHYLVSSTPNLSTGRDLGLLSFRSLTLKAGDGIAEGEIYVNAYENIYLNTSSSYTTRMFVSSSGLIGIGTTTPTTKVHIYEPLTNTTAYLTVQNNRARNAAVYTVTTNGGFYAGTSIGTDTFNYQIYDGVAGVSRITVDSAGNIGMGTSNPVSTLPTGSSVLINNGWTVNSSVIASRKVLEINSNDNNGGNVGIFLRHLDKVTGLDIWSDNYYGNAYIDSRFDNTAASIGFRLRTANQANIIQPLTITATGNVGIGITAPNGNLEVYSSTPIIISGASSSGTLHGLEFRQSNTIDAYIKQLPATGELRLYVGRNSSWGGNMTFWTDTVQRMFISSGGEVRIQGAGGSQTAFSIYDGGTRRFFCIPSQYYGYIFGGQIAANNGKYFSFGNDAGSEVGFIQVTATGVNYTSNSSDIRKKKNFENWEETVLPYFKNINPQKFNYTIEEDGQSKTKGFIAQEMYDKFPEAYPLDLDGFHSFNPGGMVVYLIKAIQELKAQNDDLQSQINELKA